MAVVGIPLQQHTQPGIVEQIDLVTCPVEELDRGLKAARLADTPAEVVQDAGPKLRPFRTVRGTVSMHECTLQKADGGWKPMLRLLRPSLLVHLARSVQGTSGHVIITPQLTQMALSANQAQTWSADTAEGD
ncbi:hypothetical protein [Lentzea sp. NPDC004782]|uniref:hypothetical protein n=1 Tax=Lentzea sp. NPDC004782 TaxID=3154458 RepID=UPI0033B355EF